MYQAFTRSDIERADLRTCNLIDRLAFNDCRNLYSVKFGCPIKIREGAFRNCTSLKNIEIPAKSRLSNSVFEGDDLDSVVIGANTKIHREAFINAFIRNLTLPAEYKDTKFKGLSCANITYV